MRGWSRINITVIEPRTAARLNIAADSNGVSCSEARLFVALVTRRLLAQLDEFAETPQILFLRGGKLAGLGQEAAIVRAVPLGDTFRVGLGNVARRRRRIVRERQRLIFQFLQAGG